MKVGGKEGVRVADVGGVSVCVLSAVGDGVAVLRGVGEEEGVKSSQGSFVVEGVGVGVVVPLTVRGTVAVRVGVMLG